MKQTEIRVRLRRKAKVIKTRVFDGFILVNSKGEPSDYIDQNGNPLFDIAKSKPSATEYRKAKQEGFQIKKARIEIEDEI